ncbi:cysteine hydrolase family protein [Alkalicoccus urumqiensis]|uniref:Isochorismatase n=1 Tax=Alkalicoccus urumqiensis TaxID=1548213 RepID=A0A2P6MKP6_ALKUR|nr:isochorismatase family cysteine hydrolase [Alkalicoccus urumqiensis]PRO66856.1 isochorismatase [Alkalicoccus urumqiensis]
MEAAIIIDYTNDFVADDGKLTCGEHGQSVEERITELTESWIEKGLFTVFAVDAHEAGDTYHPESALFPEHNIIGTKGRRLYGALGDLVESMNGAPYYWMDKTRYSAFAGTDLELRLRERGVTHLHLAGVCTDICVLHTAVDAYNRGFSMTIHADAVQSFDQEGHAWALRHFKQTLGADVVQKNG